MATSEAEYLKLMSDLNLCPQCQGAIAEGMGVGSGSKAKGLFCSLGCFSKYHAMEFIKKAELIKRRMPPSND
jgi:hypothetical protein